MAQNKKAMSRGSLMAVRKRMMESEPTMPRESARLLPMASMASVVITAMSTSVLLKFLLYTTPEKVFRYTKYISSASSTAAVSDNRICAGERAVFCASR